MITAFVCDRLKICMFIFSLTGVGLWGLSLSGRNVGELYQSSFCFAVLLFFVFYTVLEQLFSAFAGGVAAAVVSVLPALVIYFPVKDIESMPYLQTAVLVSAGLKLFMSFVSFREKVVLFGNFILTVGACALRFAYGPYFTEPKVETALFVCLFVLTLSGLQYLVMEKGKEPFPFVFFVALGIAIMFIPAREEPINWTPVLQVGERIVERVESAYSDLDYFTSELFKSNTYTAGYSSLSEAGGVISGKSKTELLLTPKSDTYILFEDPDTGMLMKRRKALYLSGGRGIEKDKIIEYLTFLYRSGVTADMAWTFSQKASVDIQYEYVKTKDEIVPAFSVDIMNNGRTIKEGSATSVHKKGYTINAFYIDIDYASPYFIDLIKKADSLGEEDIPYATLCDYARKLYSINLAAIVSQEDYEALEASEGLPDKDREMYLDTSGSSEKLKELANTLAGGKGSSYDKCRVIEEYLRQYPYSIAVENGSVQDMGTPEGMSTLAEEFLFKTGKGYCVHYASSMVMLLRLSGIPARCDAGYNYLYPFEKQDSYYVSGARAHTWPEAYVEGVGWNPFEPTSAYLSASDRTWNREPKLETNSEIPDYAAEYGGAYIPDISYVSEEMQESTEETRENKDAYSIANVAVLVAISVAVLILMLILFTILFRELKYRLAGSEGKLRMDVELMKKDIRRHSDDFFERGFLSDYSNRAPEGLREAVGEVFSLYYRAEYGKKTEAVISEEDSLRAKDIRKKLHLSYKKRRVALSQ